MTVLERLRDCFETIESLRGSVFLPDIHKSCEAAKEVERLLRVHAKDFLALVEVCQQIDSTSHFSALVGGMGWKLIARRDQ